MINYNQVFCFKLKESIYTNACNRCELYHRICRNLYKHSQKCFEPGNTLGEYELERLQELVMEVRKILMISTKEVMNFLTKTYNLEIDQSLIFKYAAKGLISKEQKIGQGKSKGVQTFWENAAPNKIYIIKQLLKENFKLSEIAEDRFMIYDSPPEYLVHTIIDNAVRRDNAPLHHMGIRGLIESVKFFYVAACFAAAEAAIDFNRYSFSKNLNYIYSTNVDLLAPIKNSLTVELREENVLTIPNKEWKTLKKVTFIKDKVTVA